MNNLTRHIDKTVIVLDSVQANEGICATARLSPNVMHRWAGIYVSLVHFSANGSMSPRPSSAQPGRSPIQDCAWTTFSSETVQLCYTAYYIKIPRSRRNSLHKGNGMMIPSRRPQLLWWSRVSDAKGHVVGWVK